MKKLFGTDGIRGRVNTPPMTVDVISSVGKAAAMVLRSHLSRTPQVLVGKDTRLSGYAFEYAISSGLLAGGSDVLLVGPMPTPAVAFLTSSMRLDAGVVISASHNPYHDNGVKFFNREGIKLSDEMEAEIERLVLSGEVKRFAQDPLKMGKAKRVTDARGRYIEFLKSTFPRSLSLKGVSIVLDCANGATYSIAPQVFSELDGDVRAYSVTPDGFNINSGCGSTVPEFIVRKTIEEGADVGIAFDGDGDRVIMVDEKGDILDGDDIIAILADYMERKGLLKGATVVGTVMSNMGLEKFITERGLNFVRAKVGDRFVAEEMRRSGSNLGGEESGHIIIGDYATTGDGILTALQVLRVMIEENKPLSQVRKLKHRFPQIKGSVLVHEKVPLDRIPGWDRVRAEVESSLEGRGRMLVRYSGTEPLLRIMVEAESEDLGKSAFYKLKDFFEAFFKKREEVKEYETGG